MKSSGLRRRFIFAAIGLALLVTGGAMIYQAWRISAPGSGPQSTKPDPGQLAQLQEQIEPLIIAEAEANSKALRSARTRLHEVFQKYRSRAPKFAEEMTRWGVKWKLMKSTMHDWWHKDQESARIACKMFSDHVFSEGELKRDMEEVMREFLADLEANRNRLLVDAHAMLSHSQLPVSALNADEFSKRFNQQSAELVVKRVKEVPQLALLSTAGGFSASLGAGYLAETVATLLIRWGAAAATAAGGSTVGGAVAGGGGGSTVGPWGTVIGVTAGLIVGGVVDWAMESRFKDKVVKQTREILDSMENAALKDSEKGLYATLKTLVLENKRNHRAVMRSLVDEPLP